MQAIHRLRTPSLGCWTTAGDAWELRTIAEEATDRPAVRVHSRVFLRRAMLKRLRELEARLDVVAAQQWAPDPPTT